MANRRTRALVKRRLGSSRTARNTEGAGRGRVREDSEAPSPARIPTGLMTPRRKAKEPCVGGFFGIKLLLDLHLKMTILYRCSERSILCSLTFIRTPSLPLLFMSCQHVYLDVNYGSDIKQWCYFFEKARRWQTWCADKNELKSKRHNKRLAERIYSASTADPPRRRGARNPKFLKYESGKNQ